MQKPPHETGATVPGGGIPPARFRALAFFARKLRSNRRRAANGRNSRDFASRRVGCQTEGRQTPTFFLDPSAVALPGSGPGRDGLF